MTVSEALGVLVLAMVLAAVVALGGCGQDDAPKPPAPPPAEVQGRVIGQPCGENTMEKFVVTSDASGRPTTLIFTCYGSQWKMRRLELKG